MEPSRLTPVADYLAERAGDIRAQADDMHKPFSILIAGMGKSTLVNALAGQVVSPTDSLEATGVIVEVAYGEAPTGAIGHENGEVTAGSVESIVSTLAHRRSDHQFLSSCAVVEIGCPSPLLRGVTLVDTPGLLTITEAHHARAESYVDNADLVLWVLNANYIGQEDVLRSIESVEASFDQWMEQC
ncbi:MAG: dynamin family protein [Firmicutes bacterium]|nr:dynamin family protein [Bacillota bacterium]